MDEQEPVAAIRPSSDAGMTLLLELMGRPNACGFSWNEAAEFIVAVERESLRATDPERCHCGHLNASCDLPDITEVFP